MALLLALASPAPAAATAATAAASPAPAAATAATAAPGSAPVRARAQRTSASAQKARRARRRRALLRALRRNPRIALRRSFLHEAQLVGADLPVTIRLNPAQGTPQPNSNALAVALDPATTGPTGPTGPSGPSGATATLPSGISAGTQSTSITGAIAATMDFSRDTAGYGQLGTVDLTIGRVGLTATGFPLVYDAALGSACVLTKTADSFEIVDAPNGAGVVSLFGGQFSLDLRTTFRFYAWTRNTCADPFVQTSRMDGSGRPPQPIQLDGAFRVSPDVTNDGRVRLGVMRLTGAQQAPFIKLSTCTQGPPPPATCAAGSNDATLSGRLTAGYFDADLLIGALP